MGSIWLGYLVADGRDISFALFWGALTGYSEQGFAGESFNFYDCPQKHWKKIYTTNVIERQFKEVRRRTNVFSCFSNIDSCNRIIYAIFTHINNNWKERPLRDFTQFA